MDTDTRALSERPAAFRILLVALAAVFASIVASLGDEADERVTGLVLSLSLGAALWIASRSPRLLIGGGLMIIASAAGWLSAPLGLPGSAVSIGPALSALYFAIAAAVLSPRVFQARVITEDTLVGSICVYLLLALAFACAYFALAQIDPGAFAQRVRDGAQLADFTYLSLVTMTTLGYGDITPVTGPARALAVMQATLGVLYSAIAVARLVAFYTDGGEPPAAGPPLPWHQRRLRNLFVLLCALVVILVALDDQGGGALRQILSGALLLVALYALGGGLLTRIAIAPVLVILVLRAWAGPPEHAREIVAGAIEVALFGAGLAVIARQALLRDEVSGEVLFGVCAVYVLLGAWVGSAFALCAAIAPESLSPAGPHTVGAMQYLGFMTITTTGYGDMLPAARATEMLAGIAACLGIFYPAIVVARLVSLSIRAR